MNFLDFFVIDFVLLGSQDLPWVGPTTATAKQPLATLYQPFAEASYGKSQQFWITFVTSHFSCNWSSAKGCYKVARGCFAVAVVGPTQGRFWACRKVILTMKMGQNGPKTVKNCQNCWDFHHFSVLRHFTFKKNSYSSYEYPHLCINSEYLDPKS